MAVTGALPEPLIEYRLRVDIGDASVGYFSDIAGLSVERSVEEHAEGGVNDYVHWLPGRVSRTSVTLRNGVVTAGLWAWFQKGLYDARVERRDVSIIFLDSQGNEKRRWELIEAVPIKWVGATLKSAGSGGVAVESLELAQCDVNAGAGGSGDRGEGQGEGDDIRPDVSRLAVKVYNLLRCELRTERERLGRRDFW